MSRKILAIIVFSFLASAVLLTLWYWRSNPERQIGKTLTIMAELGSAPAGESSIAKALKTRQLVEHFSNQAFIEWPGDEVIPAGRWAGREQISQQVLAAKNSANYSVSLADLAIAAKRRRADATVQFTLIAREGLDTWAWLAKANLLKADRRWLVTQLIFAPILRR